MTVAVIQSGRLARQLAVVNARLLLAEARIDQLQSGCERLYDAIQHLDGMLAAMVRMMTEARDVLPGEIPLAPSPRSDRPN